MIPRSAPVWWDEIGPDTLPGYLDEPPSAAPGRSWWSHVRLSDHEEAAPSLPFASPLPLEPLTQRRPHLLSTIFVRAFEVPFEQAAAAMERWWQKAERGGRVDIGCSRLIGPPVRELTSGYCRIGVSLSRGFPWPPLPMDLELVPWFVTFGTKIGLRPRRVLHPSRFYFASGHAALDLVVANLRREAGAGAEPR